MIRTTELTKDYRDFWGRRRIRALDGLTIHIPRGEIFGLLGPNGSGKTTTLKLILGFIFPTSGTIEVLGKKPGDSSIHRQIGFLPEESYFYRFLNAEETLDFYGGLLRIPRRERRSKARELIEHVGLAEARKRPLREYSKGMVRRVGLAQALLGDPALLILDEPTIGLDPVGAQDFKKLLLDLKAQGKTILLCTHLLAEMEEVCDRIAILYRGKLLRTGTAEELLSLKDTLLLKVKGLGPEAMGRMKSFLKGEGAEITAVSGGKESLEDLFMKTIREGIS
jgi:ABC-2 type transport system ATP-binding protein